MWKITAVLNRKKTKLHWGSQQLIYATKPQQNHKYTYISNNNKNYNYVFSAPARLSGVSRNTVSARANEAEGTLFRLFDMLLL